VQLAKRTARHGLQVVLYHHVADADGPLTTGLNVTTSPNLFDAHLDHLEREYNVVDLDAVISGNLPKRPLLITFDDGYRSVLDVAMPLLERRGLPSVFFVSAAFLRSDVLPLDNLLCMLEHEYGSDAVAFEVTRGTPAASREKLIALTADVPYSRRIWLGDQLARRFDVDQRALRARSELFLDPNDLPRFADHRCEIGNHTASHLFCRAIDDERIAEVELVEHRRRLEEWTGAFVRSFSYPYGNRADATPFVEASLAASGHEATFLVESRPNARRRTRAWNRVGLDDRSIARLSIELELLPRLRAVRDALVFR